MNARQTVLIVDDSLTVRMDLADAFSAAGFAVELCGSLADARRALAGGPVDVIVLDVLLPDGDGIELLQEIRSAPERSSAPVVMLSTEAEVADRIRGLTTGADEYVGKPYDVGYLVAKVEDLVRARRPDGATTLLLIDDSATFRDVMGRALERSGYAVITAPTGEDGLRLAGARRPDAIVVDGELPGIDGPTVIRRLRLDAALRDVPCLLLTGSAGQRSELQAFDAGADAFVRKEEDLDVVLARIAAMLRHAPARLHPDDGAKSLVGLKRILAVDDSLTYLQMLGDTLKSEGYDVILARSGEEALELLAVQPVDCIVLDVMMPGLSGPETCERIKTAPTVRDIPLIMLTALEDREAMLQGLSAGADDYISKSSDFEVLKARVRAQIRRRQFEDEHRRVREELLRKEIEAAEAQAARQLAEARAAMAEELERKNKELEAFSYSVSHDLRAPLRAIDGFSRIVAETYGATMDPKAHDYLQRVCAAAQRMGELIDDLLELSRVGRAELRRVPLNLTEIAGEVIADLQKRAERPVEVVLPDEVPAHADPRLIRIALENLLGNSWKFTAHVDRPRIEVGVRTGGDDPIYFVRDNGAGFDMQFAQKLFQPFQRMHTDADFPGTGIGLATVHRIVDRHGGRIWADSAVGEGTTFSFTLARRQAGRP
jgi:DNA-binding response OmpR family regulator